MTWGEIVDFEAAVLLKLHGELGPAVGDGSALAAIDVKRGCIWFGSERRPSPELRPVLRRAPCETAIYDFDKMYININLPNVSLCNTRDSMCLMFA